MKKLLALALVLGVGLYAAACGDGGKAAADTAIKAAGTALAAVQSDATAYVPDQLKSVQDALAAAKDSFAKGEFQAALTAAQELPAKISAMKDAAEARRAELKTSWTDLSAGLPAMVEQIQGRVDTLSKSRRLPKEITKEQFEGAKAGLDTLKATWTEATGAFEGGNLVGAVEKAQAVKAKAAEIMTALGMQAADAPK